MYFHQMLIYLCAFFSFNAIFGGIRTGLFNGYLCFVCSIAMIGVCTAVIGDVAAQLGCFICLKDSVNAIAFVALGTSVPGSHYDHNNFFFICQLANETNIL